MANAYADAGYLYDAIFPRTETSEERDRRRLFEASEALERAEGHNVESYANSLAKSRNTRIAELLKEYGVENLSPYAAQQQIFAVAHEGRQFLELLLPRIPTAQKTSTPPPNSLIDTASPTPQSTSTNSATPQDSDNSVVGTWTLEVTFHNAPTYKIPLTVKQENGNYSGVIGDSSGPITLSNITVSGNSFTFTMPNMIVQGKIVSLTFSGNVEANRITGKCSASDANGATYTIPLTGTRVTQ
jgi:hypothetical protein